MTIDVEGTTVELTPNEELQNAHHDSDVEAILTADRENGHIRVILYKDGTYADDVLAYDGQDRDVNQEARIQAAIGGELDRRKRDDK